MNNKKGSLSSENNVGQACTDDHYHTCGFSFSANQLRRVDILHTKVNYIFFDILCCIPWLVIDLRILFLHNCSNISPCEVISRLRKIGEKSFLYFFIIRLPLEFLPASGPTERWCASTRLVSCNIHLSPSVDKRNTH